jgi:hypothetical protein
MGASVPANAWGSCSFCATAVAPGATVCGICGADKPVPAGELARAPTDVRRRVRLMQFLMGALVVTVAVGLAYTMIDAVVTGPPTAADPLTTTGTYRIAPGSVPILEGNVTGGDYILGNFTSVSPYDANVTLSVYNESAWDGLVQNGTGSPAWSSPSEGSGRIVFTAEYTDDYTFVLTNGYPSASHLTITVYVATEYESNVGDDGFG